MVRVKRGIVKNKRKSKIIKMAKGFRNARSTKFKQAKMAVIRAGTHAYVHRRHKKRDMRRLWQIKISYAVQALAELSYSQFMGMVIKKGIEVDRKIMAEMIEFNPESFARLVESVTGKKNVGTIAAPARYSNRKTKKVAGEVSEVASVKKAPAKSVAKKSTKADDLAVIEGIGPKVAEALVAGGVTTFAQLADMKPAAISEMISEVRGSHDPATWPKQAKLAAEGKMDELKTLQDELMGGKVA